MKQVDQGQAQDRNYPAQQTHQPNRNCVRLVLIQDPVPSVLGNKSVKWCNLLLTEIVDHGQDYPDNPFAEDVPRRNFHSGSIANVG